MAAVHSENDHYKFYEQRGYRLTDEVYEGGRHGWLVNLQRADNQINRHDVAGIPDDRAQVKHLVKLEPAGDGVRLA